MAQNSEFIEGLSDDALRHLQKYNAELTTTIKHVKDVRAQMMQIGTPGGANNAAAELTAQYERQQRAIEEMQRKLRQVTEAQRAKNKQTAEEAVNQRILNQRASEYATINSTLAGSYQKLAASQAKSARAVQDLIARGRQAGQTQKQYNAELRAAQREFDKFNAKVRSADAAVGRFNRNVGNYPNVARGFGDLLGAFGIVGGVTAIAAVTTSIFNTTRELQSMDLALKQVMGSEEEAAKTRLFLADISERYGVSIQVMTKSYTGFYAASKNAIDSGVISADQINQIFESVSKAAGAMGLSVDQQEGAFLALSQMISKGNIQAEELRGQLSERLPGALGILAKSMGVTEQQLNKMLKDGEVLAAEVLPAFAKELEKAYGVDQMERVETLNAATTRLSNSWTNFVRNLNESDSGGASRFFTGFVSMIGGAIDEINRLMSSWENLQEKAKSKGKAAGTSAFEEQLKRSNNDAKAVFDGSQRSAEKLAAKLNAVEKQIAQTEGLLMQQASNMSNPLLAIGAGVTMAVDAVSPFTAIDKLKEERVRLMEQLAYEQGIRKAALEKMNGDKKQAEEQSTTTTAVEIEKRTALLEKEADYTFKLAKRKIEFEQQKLKGMMDNDDEYYTTRLRALELYRAKEMELITLQYNEDLKNAKGNYKLREIAFIDFQSRMLTLTEDYNEKKAKLEGLALQPAAVVATDGTDQLRTSGQAVVEMLEEQAASAESLKEIMIDLKNATQEYIASFSDGYLADAGLGSFQMFFDGTFDRLMAGAETTQEKFAVAFNSIAEAAQEAFSVIDSIQQAQFDAQYARLERQRDVAIAFAGDSATAREEIDRQYDERRRQLQRQQAEAQKRMAVFNILTNTAQGVVSALAMTPPNVPLSIAIAAIGAIQAGIVASQQIPQFWTGTDNAPEGWAWTQERGREIITDRQGRIKSTGSDKGASLTYLEKGDKVLNASKTRDLMSFDRNLNAILSGNNILPARNQSGLTEAHVSRLEAAIKAAESNKQVLIKIDESGFTTRVRTNGLTRELLNAKLSGKSLSV